MTRPLHVHYFYDEPLPNRYAASIQFLRTGAALVAEGLGFTAHVRSLEAPPATILRHYELPAGGVAVRAFFPPHRPALLRGLRLRRRFRRFVARLPPEERSVIVSRGATALLLAPELLALARRPAEARPLLLVEMHNLHFLRHAEKAAAAGLPRARSAADLALRSRELCLVAAVDGLVCLTPEVARAVAELVTAMPPHLVLPSGTELPETSPPAVTRCDLVYAGKIEPRKGVPDLLAAMAHLPGRTLAIAGGPDEAVAEMARLARSLGVAGQVSFAGLLPPGAVAGFLLGGRVGVCPLPAGSDSVSDRFTSPMKLLQMMALGMPVVASDVAPVRAIMTGGVEGVLVPPNDPPALARAIESLLGDPERARALGAAARARAQAFSWQARGAALTRFLEERAGQPRARA